MRVEPSQRFPFGVLVGVNDHYDLDTSDTSARPAADRVVEILKAGWDVSFKDAREIVAKVTQ